MVSIADSAAVNGTRPVTTSKFARIVTGSAVAIMVVGISGCANANASARRARSIPSGATICAAAAARAFSAEDPGCHTGGPRLVSNDMDIGDALITEMPAEASVASVPSSTRLVSCRQ